MSEILGINTREVWDFRLSTACVRIMRLETWIVEIWAKNLPDHVPEHKDDDGNVIPATPDALPLAVHDTGISVVKGDHHDTAKMKVCFEWLLTQRDKYALDDIEERKPAAAEINRINMEMAEAQAGLSPAEAQHAWTFLKQLKAIAKKSGQTTDEVLRAMVEGMPTQEQS